MTEQKNNGKGIFYGVIGVATLIVAIIGATFAFFTASQDDANAITGNAATISFGLSVEKITDIDDTMSGMIPMTNGMVEAAVEQKTNNEICEDDNGNAVCQIYNIKVTNTGSASIFLDGYVNLTGGAPGGTTQSPTNMRWAQVFCSETAEGKASACTMNGTPALASGATGITEIDIAASGTSNVDLDSTGATANYTYGGNSYVFINKNYMRTSGHTGTTFDRTSHLSSALVYSQLLAPAGDKDASGVATGKDVVNLYIVVWLSETGADQTITDSSVAQNFFNGQVNFLSATGGEVSATFNGYTRQPLVPSGS